MTNDTTAEHPFDQRQYWLVWVLASVAGWLVWALLFVLLTFISVADLTAELGLLIWVGYALAVGAVLGGTQWWVLRQQVPMTTRWIIFTALGFAFGTLFDQLFAGLGIGVLQWLLLRNTLNKTGWWPVVSTVAWLVGYWAGSFLGAVAGQMVNSFAVTIVVTWGVSGAIVGAITGAILLWLLRENRVLLDGLHEEAEKAKS